MMLFATDIPDAVITAAAATATIVFVGLASWALLMLVRLSSVVAGLEARLEERSADHERRLTALEVLTSPHPFGGRGLGEGA